MKTVFAGLPFYDTLEKTDLQRTRSRVPFHCPRFQLPPFLINAQSDTPGAVTRVDLMDCAENLTDITTYFVAVPALFTTTTDDYFQYKGVVLKQKLPTGQYRVKITTANGYVYYSENLVISDIYPNLIASWSNQGAPLAYDTLTTSGTTISSAITDGSDYSYARSSIFTNVRKGEQIVIRFNHTQNSGTVPFTYLIDYAIGITAKSNTANIAAGVNTITLTATAAMAQCQVVIGNTAAAANWTTSEIFVYRPYSSRFLKLQFSNTNDLGDILYQDGWFQTLWLETRLNFPLSETVEIGEERDGVFIPEKIVTKYIYRISTYISRALHRVLMRLPQHDSITITDEVGNNYTPAVGNLNILQMDWTHFETGHMIIGFNDGANTAFDWTYDMADLT